MKIWYPKLSGSSEFINLLNLLSRRIIRINLTPSNIIFLFKKSSEYRLFIPNIKCLNNEINEKFSSGRIAITGYGYCRGYIKDIKPSITFVRASLSSEKNKIGSSKIINFITSNISSILK